MTQKNLALVFSRQRATPDELCFVATDSAILPWQQKAHTTSLYGKVLKRATQVLFSSTQYHSSTTPLNIFILKNLFTYENCNFEQQIKKNPRIWLLQQHLASIHLWDYRPCKW